MQRGKYIRSSNLLFHQANKQRYFKIHVTQNKLHEFLYQASTLKNTYLILTCNFVVQNILYTSLQVLVIIEETVNLTKPAFLLTPFLF